MRIHLWNMSKQQLQDLGLFYFDPDRIRTAGELMEAVFAHFSLPSPYPPQNIQRRRRNEIVNGRLHDSFTDSVIDSPGRAGQTYLFFA